MELRMCRQASSIVLIFLSLVSYAPASNSASNPETKGPSAVSQPAVQFANAVRLVEIGKLPEAEGLVEAGLTTEPRSVRWHLLKADLLARQGRLFKLHEALETAYLAAPENIEVLTRLANCRDLYGQGAAHLYEELATRLEAQSVPVTQVIQALERGLLTGLRDGDSEPAARIEAKLRSLGQLQASRTPPDSAGAPVSTVRIPGGIQTLAVVARMPEARAPRTFVRQYADRLVRWTQGQNNPSGKQLVTELKEYFQTLAKLQALMEGSEDSFKLWLNLKDKRSEEVLRLLGWRLKQSDRRPFLELGTDPSDSRRQGFALALGLDQAAMKMQLESGLPFSLTIKSERAAVIPDNAFWYKKILNDAPTSGDLLEAFLDHLPAARLYVALSGLTEETRRQVLLASDANALLNRYADLLYAYGSALLVQNGELVVPGGIPALSLWGELAGASPRQPAQFIGAALAKDGGKLLAYFHLMVHLPPPNQQFLTRSSVRFNAFYRVFPFADRRALKAHTFARYDAHFEDLLKELPLDAQGRIEFPGGADAWRGSKATLGPSLPKQGSTRTLSLDEEDELLFMLLADRDKGNIQEPTLAETFLAVTRIQRHRRQPLDKGLAVLLSQKHAKYREIFPYLASLPDLTASEIALFFEAASHLEDLSGTRLNLALGEFHSLIQWLILLSGNDTLRSEDAGRLFALLCQGFANARTDGDFAAHSCDMVLQIASAVHKASSREDEGRLVPFDSKAGSPSSGVLPTGSPFLAPAEPTGAGSRLGLPASADTEDSFFRAFAGAPREAELVVGNRRFRLNYPAWRKQRMQEILELQTVPSLNALLAIYQNAKALARGEGSADQALSHIEVLLPKLREPDQANWKRLRRKQRAALVSETGKRDIIESLAEIRKLLNRGGSQDIPKLAMQLIGCLNPYVQTTLLGWVYASYFSPRDLIMEGDPWFLRKHEFSVTFHKRDTWPATRVRSGGSEVGSYLTGGLAQIAAAAGAVGLIGVEASESAGNDIAASKVAAMQLASLRAMSWARLDEHDLRLLALKVLLGREVLAKAALRPEIQEELAEPLLDLVGLRRRAELLQFLSNRDLTSVFSLLSASDLYFLADWYWQRFKVSGWKADPLEQALERETRRKGNLQVSLPGGYQPKLDGCIRPHLVHLGPYEGYEGFLLGDRMAERLSPILLDLAAPADRLGLPVDALGVLAEKAVQRTARRALMADSDDWEAALQAMRSLRLEPLLELLEETP